MLKAKRLKNISDKSITVIHRDHSSIVPPGVELEDIDIANENELKGKASIVFDLTEVNTISKKTRLDD